jgi:hypothetical protein
MRAWACTSKYLLAYRTRRSWYYHCGCRLRSLAPLLPATRLRHPHVIDEVVQRELGLGRGLAGPRPTHSRVEDHVVWDVEKLRELVVAAERAVCDLLEHDAIEREVNVVGRVLDGVLVEGGHVASIRVGLSMAWVFARASITALVTAATWAGPLCPCIS